MKLLSTISVLLAITYPYPACAASKAYKDVKNIDASQEVFFLKSIFIQGNNSIPTPKLLNNTQQYINKNLNAKALNKLTEHIKKMYAEAGYLLTDVSIKSLNKTDNSIIFEVVEGYIESTFIKSDLKNKLPEKVVADINFFLDKIKRDKPLTKAVYEKYAVSILEIPGLKAEFDFVKGEKYGSANLIIKVLSYQKVNIDVTFNNHLPKSLDYYLAKADAALHHGMHKLDIGATKSFGSRFHSENIAYNYRFKESGLLTEVALGRIRAKPNLNVASTTQVYDRDDMQVKLALPIISSVQKNFYLNTEFEVLNARNGSNVTSNTFYDKIRSLRFGFTYSDFVAEGYNSINPALWWGLKGLGYSAGQDNKSRVTGRNNYKKIVLPVSRLQMLNDKVSILAAVKAQYSFQSLLSATEMDFGGVDFGRGYESGVIVGDYGAVSKFEIIYNQPLQRNVAGFMEYAAFYDLGWISSKKENKITVNGESRKKASASSAGVRMSFRRDSLDNSKGWGANFIIAKPLTFPDANHGKNIRFVFGGFITF